MHQNGEVCRSAAACINALKFDASTRWSSQHVCRRWPARLVLAIGKWCLRPHLEHARPEGEERVR